MGEVRTQCATEGGFESDTTGPTFANAMLSLRREDSQTLPLSLLRLNYHDLIVVVQTLPALPLPTHPRRRRRQVLPVFFLLTDCMCPPSIRCDLFPEVAFLPNTASEGNESGEQLRLRLRLRSCIRTLCRDGTLLRNGRSGIGQERILNDVSHPDFL